VLRRCVIDRLKGSGTNIQAMKIGRPDMYRRESVFPPFRDHAPHPAPGIVGVAAPAGDEVDVGVKRDQGKAGIGNQGLLVWMNTGRHPSTKATNRSGMSKDLYVKNLSLQATEEDLRKLFP
jgi:hypothetical protein